MSARRLPVLITAGLALALLAAWLPGQLHPYREVVERGPAAEVRANPYLAAELFLRHQGIEVQHAGSLETLETLPEGANTLLLLGGRGRMTPQQAERILDWTAAGGRLVFVAEQLWNEETGSSGDLLLDGLGIQQHLSADLAIGDVQLPRSKRQPQLSRFHPPGDKEKPALLAFDNAFHLYDSHDRAYALARSGEATHLLQLRHGRGDVTVLTDAWIWENPRIGEYDHAWLLWYLSRDSRVTLIHRLSTDSLASLLLRHFPAALLALLLLLGGLLWRAGLRQGPVLPPGRPARRQLEEHLRASADFLLRRCGQASLLQTLQQDIRRRAEQRIARFAERPKQEQWALLARFGQMPAEHIGELMQPPDKTLPAADFTRQVADLQRLRNAF